MAGVLPFVAACSGKQAGTPAPTALNASVALVGLRTQGQLTQIGRVDVTYTQPASGTILNVAADLDGNGSFGAGETIVDNLPVDTAVPELRAYFAIAAAPPGPVKLRAVLSASAVTQPWDGAAPAGAAALDASVTMTLLDVTMPAAPPPGRIAGGTFVENVPNRPQADNNCFAHAIANSLLWLARKHNMTVIGHVDVAIVDEVNDGLFEVIGDILGFFTDHGYYKEDQGATSEKMLEAKQAYVKSVNLPIETRRVPPGNSDNSGTGVFDAVKQALEDGCMVELVIGGFDAVSGSHMVSLVGYQESGDGASIKVHDSLGSQRQRRTRQRRHRGLRDAGAHGADAGL